MNLFIHLRSFPLRDASDMQHSSQLFLEISASSTHLSLKVSQSMMISQFFLLQLLLLFHIWGREIWTKNKFFFYFQVYILINELEMKCKKHLSHKTKFPSDHFSDFNTKFYIRVAITNQNIDITILKNIENSLLINCFFFWCN